MGIVKKLTLAHLLITLIIMFILMGWAWHWQSLSFADDQALSTNYQKLLNDKLQQEIEKLKNENKNLDSFWGQFPTYSTFTTSLALPPK